jgi:acyl-coenzyme A thioesterase PaaI-like protein
MKITKIPFIAKVGIKENQDGYLVLDFDESIQNHLQSIHASALFALAETASGHALQMEFPDLAGKVVPLLRDSQIKFKKSATTAVTAYPEVSQEDIEKFQKQFDKKGRSVVPVTVDIKDSDGVVVCSGKFGWFVQTLE